MFKQILVKTPFIAVVLLIFAPTAVLASDVKQSKAEKGVYECMSSIYGRMSDTAVDPLEPLRPGRIFLDEFQSEIGSGTCFPILVDHFRQQSVIGNNANLTTHIDALLFWKAFQERNPEELDTYGAILLQKAQADDSVASFHLWGIDRYSYDANLSAISKNFYEQWRMFLDQHLEPFYHPKVEFLKFKDRFFSLEEAREAEKKFIADAVARKDDSLVDAANHAYLCARKSGRYSNLEEIDLDCDKASKSLELLFWVQLLSADNGKTNQFLQTKKDLIKNLVAFLSADPREIFLFTDFSVLEKAHYLLTQIAIYHIHMGDEVGQWIEQNFEQELGTIATRFLETGHSFAYPALRKTYTSVLYLLSAPLSDVELPVAPSCSEFRTVGPVVNPIPRKYRVVFLGLNDYRVSLDTFAQNKYGLSLSGYKVEVNPALIYQNQFGCSAELYYDNSYRYPIRYFEAYKSGTAIQDIRFANASGLPELHESNIYANDVGIVTWNYKLDFELESDFDLSLFPATIPSTGLELNFYTVDLDPYYSAFDGFAGSRDVIALENDSPKGIGADANLQVARSGIWGNLNFDLTLKPQHIFYFAKVIFPAFAFMAMGLMTLIRPLKDSEANLQVATTAVLSAVAYQFVINESLPALNYLTLADTFLLTMFVSLVFCVAFNLVPHVVADEAYSNRLLLWTRWLAVSFALATAIVFFVGLAAILGVESPV